MRKKNIAVLFGGCSSEYDVSLQSAYAVVTHLSNEQYEPILIGITRDGAWYRFKGDVECIKDDTWRSGDCCRALISPDRQRPGLLQWGEAGIELTRLDAAFPVLHGKNGEDGTVQGLLELADIPIVGCDARASAICMDKDLAHRLAKSAGVQVPKSLVLYANDRLKQVEKMSFPVFVKPARAGSSFGITKVAQQADLKGAIETAFEHDDKVIIEEAIPGFEVGCAILGNDTLTIGEVDEVELQQGWFDYTEKYALVSAQIHTPARIDEDTAARVKTTAATLYRSLGCRGFARIDLFLTPEGDIVFNEVNTIPGMTPHSRYPRMLACVGMSFGTVLEELIALAV